MSTRIRYWQRVWLGWFALALVAVNQGVPLAAGAERLGPDEVIALRTATPPNLDGDLADAAWQAAPRVEKFADPNTAGAPFRAMAMKMLYDDNYLYLGVWCAEPHPGNIKAIATPKKDVWEDDCLELFIRHTPEPNEYIQLITNTKDVHEDHNNLLSNSPGTEWTSTWETRTKVGTDSWTTEIRIPLKEIGVAHPVLRGDFLPFRLGREIWSENRPGDRNTPAHLCVWPAGRNYSGPLGYGKIYFDGKNLLANPEFSGQPDARGFYPDWGGTTDAPAFFKITNESGERVVVVDAARGTSSWFETSPKVRTNDTYQVRAEVRGNASGYFQVRVPVAGQERLARITKSAGPCAEWTPIEFVFSSSAPGIGFSFRAGAKTPGQSVSFRRLEIVKQASGARPYYLTWQIKEPLPRHGLEALAARRFGIKPYDLLAEKECRGERTVFHDSSTGTELWLMTRDRSNEGHTYHNLIWIFSFNGRWIWFSSDRLEKQLPKYEIWAANTDGSAIIPLAKRDTANYHWSPRDGNIFYHDLRAKTGQVYEVNVATGQRRLVTELGPWLRPFGILARPGPWSDRLVLVNPDLKTGFTIKLDGTDRKDVTFEGGRVKELYFSTGHPDILYSRGNIYRLEKDGSITRICSVDERAQHGYQNMSRPGHGDNSKSELYGALADGNITNPDGSTEKVYDPRPYEHLGGFIGQNGYASWGPTDDWLIIEYGFHFVKIRRDGRGQDFLGFHFSMSLDYNSMAWGQVSPDGTKIASKTTMFDNSDLLMMIVSRPLPPTNLRVTKDALTWEPPTLHNEIKGYLVYAAEKSGGPYRPVVKEPVIGSSWTIPKPDGNPGFYVVTAIEYSGLESPYSNETEVDVKGDIPVRLFAEAELLQLETPVVERREMSASDWHYVVQDPYQRQKNQRDGRVVWQCAVPPRLAKTPLTLWARVRTQPGLQGAVANVLLGKGEAQLTAESEIWDWVRAVGPKNQPALVVPESGIARVTIVPQSAALAMDMLALTSNPEDKPIAQGYAALPPPAELKAVSAGAEETFLTWRASPEPDVVYYNVYASMDDKLMPIQKNLVGSPSQPKFVDWGLRPGAVYRYVVTAVNRAGVESQPSTVISATTKAKDTDTIRLESEAAQPTETGEGDPLSFQAEDKECSGGRFVGMKVPGDEKTPLPDRLKQSPRQLTLTWKFNVKTPGEYKVWLRLRSRDIYPRFSISADGNEVCPSMKHHIGWYDARAERSMWGQADKAYRWFWMEIPRTRQLDPRQFRITFSAGEHELKLSNIRAGLDVDAVVLTSDFSWIPEGSINYY